jgi:site-specific recombinase XerC
MSDRPAIEQFQADLIGDGIEERTALLYARDVERFFAGDNAGSIDGLVPTLIKRWLDYLADEGYAASTITRRLTSLRRYCRWLVSRGELVADPSHGLSAPSSEREPTFAARDVVEAVLLAPDYDTVIGVRDRAMLTLLADTGMELGELCTLDLSDVAEKAETIAVGHDRRCRSVYLYSARRPLLGYVHYVRDFQSGEALFLNCRGERIGPGTIRHRVEKYRELVGADITAADLIREGRRRRAARDPEYAAKELGFARSGVVQRRYQKQAAFSDSTDGRSEDSDTVDAAQAVAPSWLDERRRSWATWESRAADAAKAPRPAGEVWRAATRLHAGPADRIRALAQPVAEVLEALGEEDATATDDPAPDLEAELLQLHRQMRDDLPGLRVWAGMIQRYPDVHRRVKRLRGREDEAEWTDVALAEIIFGSPERVLDWSDQVLSTFEGQRIIWRLISGQRNRLLWVRECAAEYYGVPSDDRSGRTMDAALVVACVAGLVLCGPDAVERARASEVVEEPATMYFLDTVSVVLHQLLRLLGLVTKTSSVSSDQEDSAFGDAFEREWDELLSYANGFFGFAVIPRVSYEDMVRYHTLRYAPHGDLAKMPYEVGDYLVHQAKASGHFLRPIMEGQLREAFFDCVRPLYDKLLRSFVGKARGALTQRVRDQDGNEIFARATEEVEAAFREAYDRYDFYQHPPGAPRTTVSSGLLGFRRRGDIRRLADELGVDCEQARTPFAAYARGHLRRAIVKLQRESLEDQDQSKQKKGLVIEDPKGQCYRTIEALARWVKRSASYLRDLDDLLQPVRVSDVFDGPHSNRKGLHDNTRLYPADGDSLDSYKELLQEQHPRLAAEGLRTERQTAARLGVSVWWLRSRRERGLLEAGQKGRFVVYNAAQRQAAQRLLWTETGESQKELE